ncbi:MAG: amidophosphoribosyltransferase, partial [Alphaproteobacteria bacterium HGW-Alphaproteobacteria-2]
MLLQSALRLIYPPCCIACGVPVAGEFGLCGPCWGEAGFLSGLACDACGVPLPGTGGGAQHCDVCLASPRPWARGRAAMLYGGTTRRLVLGLKHGDRTDLARPLGHWLARAARPLVGPGTLIAPVPLHWRRLVARRFNQSALLARTVARELGAECCPDLLVRRRATRPLEGMTRIERQATLVDAIAPHPRRGARARGRPVLLIDDVLTSGATLAAATAAALEAGAARVDVAV